MQRHPADETIDSIAVLPLANLGGDAFYLNARPREVLPDALANTERALKLILVVPRRTRSSERCVRCTSATGLAPGKTSPEAWIKPFGWPCTPSPG